MNARQRWVLVLGIGVTVSVLALGTSRSRPVVAGPLVEYAPRQYSRDFTDASLPKPALLIALGLAALTGATLYWTRTVKKTP
jgi:hypothetical protein